MRYTGEVEDENPNQIQNQPVPRVSPVRPTSSPIVTSQPTETQPAPAGNVVSTAPAHSASGSSSTPPAVPTPNKISPEAAEALLAINHLERKPEKSHLSKSTLWILLIILLVLAVVSAIVLPRTLDKHSSTSKKGSGLTNLGVPPGLTQAPTSSSIKSQAQYCTNPINAALTC